MSPAADVFIFPEILRQVIVFVIFLGLGQFVGEEGNRLFPFPNRLVCGIGWICLASACRIRQFLLGDRQIFLRFHTSGLMRYSSHSRA